jgi:hypothetical protein
VHFRLRDGTPFILRVQNVGGDDGVIQGMTTGIRFRDGAARVLRD